HRLSAPALGGGLRALGRALARALVFAGAGSDGLSAVHAHRRLLGDPGDVCALPAHPAAVFPLPALGLHEPVAAMARGHGISRLFSDALALPRPGERHPDAGDRAPALDGDALGRARVFWTQDALSAHDARREARTGLGAARSGAI